MRKSIGILILAAQVLLAGGACTRVQQPTGTVTLTFSTEDIKTKAGDGVVADGGGIYCESNTPDLVIMLFDTNGDLTAQYPSGGSLTYYPDTCAIVQFTGISSGEYDVYAVANIADTEGNLTHGISDWTVVTKAQMDALTFTELTSPATPTVSTRMPLSAKGTITVNDSGNGQADLDLLRCVAKVGLTFNNLTGTDLALTNCSVTLTEMNPTTGYLFEPEGDDSAGTLNTLTLTSATAIDIASAGTGAISPLYVFPSVPSAGYYSCSISFTVNDEDKSFSGLPVHNNKSQNITALERNQYLKIETRISNKTEISFNFEVLDWTPKTETVVFH